MVLVVVQPPAQSVVQSICNCGKFLNEKPLPIVTSLQSGVTLSSRAEGTAYDTYTFTIPTKSDVTIVAYPTRTRSYTSLEMVANLNENPRDPYDHSNWKAFTSGDDLRQTIHTSKDDSDACSEPPCTYYINVRSRDLSNLISYFIVAIANNSDEPLVTTTTILPSSTTTTTPMTTTTTTTPMTTTVPSFIPDYDETIPTSRPHFTLIIIAVGSVVIVFVPVVVMVTLRLRRSGSRRFTEGRRGDILLHNIAI